MRIYIDFDHTICPNGYEDFPPSDECIAAIAALKAAGHHICMYSVRSNPEQTSKRFGQPQMIQYLQKYGIKYDDIHTHKPIYDLLIDDRALGSPLDSRGNVDWKQVTNFLLENKVI
jgi:hypothetical protein